MLTDHFPIQLLNNPFVSFKLQETVRAMNWVIEQGYALYWGTSEWSAEQLQEVGLQDG